MTNLKTLSNTKSRVEPALQANWTSIQSGTYLFALAKPRRGSKPTTVTSVRYSPGLVAADDVIQAQPTPISSQEPSLVRNLAQLKAWHQSISNKTYVVPYGYNLYSPGDLYQLVYVGVPEGFVVRDASYELKVLADKLRNWADPVSVGASAKPVILEGDISGIYYDHQWVDQLTTQELNELLYDE